MSAATGRPRPQVSLSGRLVRTLVSCGIGQAIGLISQLCLLPLFLGAWGKEVYAEWVLLSAVPSYLSVSDLGFSIALGNHLAMRSAAGLREDAVEAYRAGWAVVTLLTIALAVICLTFIPLFPVERLLHLQVLSHETCVKVLDMLVLQILVLQQTGIFRSAFRGETLHVIGNHIANGILVAQFLAMVAVALTRASVIVAAGASLAVTALGALVMLVVALRLVPWLRPGFRGVRFTRISALLLPGLSQNLLGLTNAINLQGAQIIIAGILSPQVALVFSTTRTLARLVNQLTNMVEMAFGPELSVAIGSGDYPLARKLNHRASQLSAWTGLAFSAVIAIVGPFIYAHWTRGKLQLDPTTFGILLLAQVANAIYFGSLSVPIAVNRNIRLATWSLVVWTCSLGLVWIGVRTAGLPGAALASLAGEMTMLMLIVPYACSIVHDRVSDWAKATFSFDFNWVLAHWLARRAAKPRGAVVE